MTGRLMKETRKKLSMAMDRKERIEQLRLQRFTFQQIGELLGISKQRAHQILSGNNKKDYDVIKDAIFERDGNVCRWCKKQVDLMLHHIDGNDANNNPKNLLTMCRG